MKMNSTLSEAKSRTAGKMNDDFKKYLQALSYSTTTIAGHLTNLNYLTAWAEKERLDVDQSYR